MMTLSDLFLLGWLVTLVQCETGKIPPPSDVSLSWVNEFCYKLSWTPPLQNQSCNYKLDDKIFREPEIPHYSFYIMNGGVLNLSLSATCEQRESDVVFPSLVYSELVEDFDCVLRSNHSFLCTWRPVEHVADLRLYYRLEDNRADDYSYSTAKCPAAAVVECPAYQSGAGGTQTGCALQGNFLHHVVYFLFNGTVHDTLAKNTFEKSPSEKMQPSALNWTAVRKDGGLFVSWTPVGLAKANSWQYVLNYTECGAPKSKIVEHYISSIDLVLGHCEYRISMKAVRKDGHGETLPGPVQVYAGNQKLLFPLVCVIVLVTVTAIVVVALVCFRRHKDKFLPKVPEPQDLLQDMFLKNSASRSVVLYVPAQEEEPQNVSVVVDTSKSNHSAYSTER